MSLFVITYSSCRKTNFAQPKKATPSESYSMPLQINLEDVYAVLPKTILYNLGDSAVFYLGRSTYSYYQTEGKLVVHIPTGQDSLHFLYAVKDVENPENTKIYAVRFFPDGVLNTTQFSGKMEWYDFQNGTVYGVKYQDNIPESYASPMFFVDTGWEQCMIDQNDFEINQKGKIVVSDSNADGSSIAPEGIIPMRSPYDCPNFNKGNGFFSSLAGFFAGIGRFIGGLFEGGGTSNDGSGGGIGWGDGDNWDWNDFPAPGPDWPGGIPPGYPPMPPGGGGGGGGGTPPPPDDGGGSDSTVVYAPNLPWVSNVSGVYEIKDKIHNNNVAPFVDGLTEIHTDYTFHEIGGGIDSNGFYYSRITALKIYLQAHPYGMIDCWDINNMPMNLLQNIDTTSIPQSVLTAFELLVNNNYPKYTTSNTFIQKLDEAHGVVNMDYFPVHITQMPENPIAHQTMSPSELLDYFRKNITNTFNVGNNVTFAPYVDNDFQAGVHINFANQYNSSDVNSMGSWVHIHIPLGPFYNDGSVIESNYEEDAVASNYYFTFTTIATPIDGKHPVAGNRRFGIKTSSQGGYVFYISGVDRVWAGGFAFINNHTHFGFNQADELWENIQSNMISFINHHGGSASYFTQHHKSARVDWQDPVVSFLKGQITLQQLKTELNCP